MLTISEQIITLLKNKPMSIRQLADSLNVQQYKIRYHLKKVERNPNIRKKLGNLELNKRGFRYSFYKKPQDQELIINNLLTVTNMTLGWHSYYQSRWQLLDYYYNNLQSLNFHVIFQKGLIVVQVLNHLTLLENLRFTNPEDMIYYFKNSFESKYDFNVKKSQIRVTVG